LRSTIYKLVRPEARPMPMREPSTAMPILLGLLAFVARQVPAQEPTPPPPSAAAPRDASFDLASRAATHWAFQPLAAVEPPDAGPAGAPRHPVDAFAQARLRAAGLSPSPPAPPATLLRRLWFDLVGLPVPPDVLARFLADPSDAAYDRQIDELLASPQFAERWARHWLDLVRYAETLGHEYDYEIPNAWRYRDYVIRAIAADVPFDQFVREHIAGDLLPTPRRGPTGENESVQATAAWWFAEQTHSPVDPMQHTSDRIDNQIDVLGKAVLGLTVACARCHDHKFDAISTQDYYALFGFVHSSRYVQAPLQPVDVNGNAYAAALAAQRAFAGEWLAALPADEPAAALLRQSPPERWSGGAGYGPLRAGDELVAAADVPGTWWPGNDGFGPAPWRGPWCPDPQAAAPALQLLPGAFWHSGIAGLARDGVLQSATFPLTRRYLHVRAAGRHARINVVVDGLHVVRDPIYGELHRAVGDPLAHWLTFDTAMWQGRRGFLQCLDQRAQDLGDADRERQAYPDDAWLAVQCAVLSDHREPPPADAGQELPKPHAEGPTAAVLDSARRLAAAQAALPVSPTLPALADGTGVDEPVHLRGSHRTPGPMVPRRFLQALAGDAPLATGPGSGRLQLAEAVLAKGNPLPARVFVNRVWHHLFGRGLAKTVDNLGALGEPPTHPELLDWLARDFVAHGWSRKHVVRRIVRSATYRQASGEVPAAADADPDNLLLHRQNVRRLEAEVVRDALLAVSDSLRQEPFGPPVPIPLDDDHEARGKPEVSGPLDGDGRRSLYLAVRRNFLPPMLLAFDLPTPFATVGARNVSNVPAQALALLNDPFVHEMCARWAQRLAVLPAAERLDAAYRLAFARPPDTAERERCMDFLAATAAARQLPDDDPQVLAELLHGLVNCKEFTYRR
jgi:hypothetical protein